MNLSWQRRVIWLAIMLIIIAALAYGFRPQPRLVDVAAAIQAPMQVTVEEEGKSRVIDRYIVSAPVAGTTCRIDLDVGDQVERDQPLLVIRPLRSQALDARSLAEARSHVAAASSALRAAEQNATSVEAEAELAKKELARLQPLAEKGHISHQEKKGSINLRHGENLCFHL